MPLYEMCFALRPHTEEDLIKSIKERIRAFIEQNEGTLETLEEIGRKKLAYEVEKEEEGIFFRITFTLNSSPSVEELIKWMRARDEVIRLILVKKNKFKIKGRKEGEVNVK